MPKYGEPRVRQDASPLPVETDLLRRQHRAARPPALLPGRDRARARHRRLRDRGPRARQRLPGRFGRGRPPPPGRRRGDRAPAAPRQERERFRAAAARPRALLPAAQRGLRARARRDRRPARRAGPRRRAPAPPARCWCARTASSSRRPGGSPRPTTALLTALFLHRSLVVQSKGEVAAAGRLGAVGGDARPPRRGRGDRLLRPGVLRLLRRGRLLPPARRRRLAHALRARAPAPSTTSSSRPATSRRGGSSSSRATATATCASTTRPSRPRSCAT